MFSFAAEARVVVTNGIPNFQQVDEKVYRGGRVREGGYEFLQGLGVKTIINLEFDEEGIAEERAGIRGSGMKMISVPMQYRTAPTDEVIDDLLAKLQDPRLQPVYLHCKHGKDRTGLVMALYRVEVQGWTPKRAHDEMMELGFAKFWRVLEGYYKRRTGLRSQLPHAG